MSNCSAPSSSTPSGAKASSTSCLLPVKGPARNGITRIVQLPDHDTLSFAHNTPSSSAETGNVSPTAAFRANQGMLSSVTKSCSARGNAHTPSLLTGGGAALNGSQVEADTYMARLLSPRNGLLLTHLDRMPDHPGWRRNAVPAQRAASHSASRACDRCPVFATRPHRHIAFCRRLLAIDLDADLGCSLFTCLASYEEALA
jgi:hypothetical protein